MKNVDGNKEEKRANEALNGHFQYEEDENKEEENKEKRKIR